MTTLWSKGSPGLQICCKTRFLPFVLTVSASAGPPVPPVLCLAHKENGTYSHENSCDDNPCDLVASICCRTGTSDQVTHALRRSSKKTMRRVPPRFERRLFAYFLAACRRGWLRYFVSVQKDTACLPPLSWLPIQFVQKRVPILVRQVVTATEPSHSLLLRD